MPKRLPQSGTVALIPSKPTLKNVREAAKRCPACATCVPLRVSCVKGCGCDGGMMEGKTSHGL